MIPELKEKSDTTVAASIAFLRDGKLLVGDRCKNSDVMMTDASLFFLTLCVPLEYRYYAGY